MTTKARERSTIERFSRGETIDVEVDHIERELAALWQAAGRTAAAEAASDGSSPGGATDSRANAVLSRASLWNIVVPVHGAESLRHTKGLLDEVMRSIPARVIVLNTVSGPAEKSVQASIENNVVARTGGARMVSSEEITLTARGGGEEHFGALVRALQFPSLPTATFWIDSMLAETLLTRDLLPISERLIVDTGRCLRLGDVTAVERLAALTSAVVADLGWLRLASFRTLFAGLFDPPVGGGPLQAARRVTVAHRRQSQASALLLAAWLGNQLSWQPLRADDGAAGVLQLRFRRRDALRADDDVAVELVPSEGECGTSGIVALGLTTGEDRDGDRYSVRRTEGNHAELAIPIAPPRAVKLDSRSDAELCVAALGPQGHDPLLRRTLAYAARLSDLVDGPSRG